MGRIRRPGELLKKPSPEEVIERGAEGAAARGTGDDRVTVNVYLPRKALPVIDAAARRLGVTSRSSWIQVAIREKLRRDGEEEW